MIGVKDKNITSFEINENTKTIYDFAFELCSNLANIEIPSSVTSIGERAFNNCSSLKSVKISSSVTSIGNYAFGGCYGNLAIYCEAVNKPSGWSSTWNKKSSNGYQFYSVVWNFKAQGATESGLNWQLMADTNEITIISFSGTSTEVVIPSTIDGYSVTNIGSSAFSYCRSLTSIVIPNSVTSIGSYAFYYCDNLRTIYCEAASKPSGWSSGWNVEFSSYYYSVVWGHKIENE